MVGFDYRYGYKGLGNSQTIKTDSDGLIEVTVIDEIKYDNQKLGSTLIRRYLNEGKIEDVTALWDGFTKSKDKSSQEAKSVANSTSRPQTSPSGRILRRYGREFMLPSSSLTAINISGYAISVTIRPLIPKKNDAWKSICLVLTGIYMPK